MIASSNKLDIEFIFFSVGTVGKYYLILESRKCSFLLYHKLRASKK
jgi:hypothetical protein